MSAISTRLKALSIFRKLHRTRQHVFKGDIQALAAAREKINAEFRANSKETDAEKIDQKLGLAVEAEEALRITVVQARRTKEGSYEVRVDQEHHLEENMPFDPNAILPKRPRKGKSKCGEEPR